MSYKITIEKIAVEETVLPKQWQVITEINGEIKRGYTPETTTIQTIKRDIYQQTVEDLNIIAVILAVNTPPSEQQP